MTKAHALRNYLNKVYDIDSSGMSEVSVWKDFLKQSNDFDSNATSMVGIYTEMADNEISFGGGGGGSAKILMAVAGTEDNMVASYSTSISDGVTKYYPCIKITGAEIPRNLKPGDLLYSISDIDVGVTMYKGSKFMDYGELLIIFDTFTYNTISLVMQSSGMGSSTQQEALDAATAMLPSLIQSNIRLVFLQDPLGVSAPDVTPSPTFDPPGGGSAN